MNLIEIFKQLTLEEQAEVLLWLYEKETVKADNLGD